MITQKWSTLDGLPLFSVSVSTALQGSVADETARTIETALAIITEQGFDPRHIVRSRLFTRDRESRQLASDVRRVLLKGSLRGSSSSFFDAPRLAENTRVQLDLDVLAPGEGAEKQVVEYDPPIAPPKFVRLGRLVFLSGITDTGPGLGAQVPAIAKSIRASLADAGTDLQAARIMSVFLAREEDPRAALRLVGEAFPDLPCPVSLTPVGGYSAPEKRVEIEVTAAAR